jgi:anti-sigma factor RsiW
MKVKTCTLLKESLIDLVERKIDPTLRVRLIQHTESCQACRELVEAFELIWRSADQMEEIEPPRNFRAQLQSKLDAVDERRGRKSLTNRLVPILQPAAAFALLVSATVLGYSFGRIPGSASASSSSEVSDIWSEYGLESFDRYPEGSLADIYFKLDDNGGDES